VLIKYEDHQNEVLALDVFQMDGNVFASGSSDLTFRIWDIRMKKACFRVFADNKCGVSSIKFMPENINTLAVGYEDATVRIWDLRSIFSVGKLNEEEDYAGVTSMSFSKSGRLLFTAYQSNYIRVWDLLTETSVCEFGRFEHSQSIIKSISMSEDGQQLISVGKDGKINKWDF
jgi:guanine nucleotide-binding protein G(I)/G(S)/G(T) subunit beta-1